MSIIKRSKLRLNTKKEWSTVRTDEGRNLPRYAMKVTETLQSHRNSFSFIREFAKGFQ